MSGKLAATTGHKMNELINVINPLKHSNNVNIDSNNNLIRTDTDDEPITSVDIKMLINLNGNEGGTELPSNRTANDDDAEEKETKVDTHPELSKYTSVGQNKVHSFKTQQDGPRPCGSCSSFSESKSVKFSKDAVQTKNWIAYNTKYIR